MVLPSHSKLPKYAHQRLLVELPGDVFLVNPEQFFYDFVVVVRKIPCSTGAY